MNSLCMVYDLPCCNEINTKCKWVICKFLNAYHFYRQNQLGSDISDLTSKATSGSFTNNLEFNKEPFFHKP